MVLGITPLLSVLRSITGAVCFFLLSMIISHPRYDRKKTAALLTLALLLGSAIMTVWVLQSPETYGPIGCIFILAYDLFFEYLLCRESLDKLLYLTSLNMFVAFYVNYLGLCVTILFFHGNVWVNIGIRFLYTTLLPLFYLKFIRKPFLRMLENPLIHWTGISLVSFLGNLLFTATLVYPDQLNRRGAYEQVYYVAFGIVFLLTHFFMLKMMDDAQTAVELRETTRLLEMNNRFLKGELTLQKVQNETAARQRHDTRHHILAINEYLNQRDYAGMQDYLKKLDATLDADVHERLCENIAANHIVGAYLKKAQEKGVETTVSLNIPANIGIRDTDLIVVFGNTLDNAINGCLSSGAADPFLYLTAQNRMGRLILEIKNSCSNSVRIEDGLPKRKNGGGIGVSGIKRVVEEYGGILDFSVENQVFTVRIVIDMPERTASE